MSDVARALLEAVIASALPADPDDGTVIVSYSGEGVPQWGAKAKVVGRLADAVVPVLEALLADQRTAIAQAIDDHRGGWASMHPQEGFGQGLKCAGVIVREHRTRVAP